MLSEMENSLCTERGGREGQEVEILVDFTSGRHEQLPPGFSPRKSGGNDSFTSDDIDDCQVERARAFARKRGIATFTGYLSPRASTKWLLVASLATFVASLGV